MLDHTDFPAASFFGGRQPPAGHGCHTIETVCHAPD